MVSVTRDLGRSWAVHPSDGELGVAAWTSHRSTMRNIMEALEEKVKTHRGKAASRIQANWRFFSTQRRTKAMRCSRAAIRVQCAWRAFLSKRPVKGMAEEALRIAEESARLYEERFKLE